MAFPAESGSRVSLGDVLRRVRNIAAQIRSSAATLRANAAAGPVNALSIINYCQLLSDFRTQLQTLAATPGLGAYAQAELGSPTLNIAAEFTAMQTQIAATIQWIVANLPNDGGTFLLVSSLNASGQFSWRTFSTAQTAGLRTALDALIASID